MNKTRYVFRMLLTISILMSIVTPFHIEAKEEYDNSEVEIYNKRLQLFKNMEIIYQIPWYYIAAIDQFERNIQPASRRKETKDRLIAIHFSKEKWAGLLHPDPDDQNPGRISFFNGLGLDGDGDGKADRNNDLDALVALLTHFSRYGFNGHDLANEQMVSKSCRGNLFKKTHCNQLGGRIMRGLIVLVTVVMFSCSLFYSCVPNPPVIARPTPAPTPEPPMCANSWGSWPVITMW